MAAPLDNDPSLQQYAHPECLVTPQWLGAHLGSPEVKVIEADQDPIIYTIGHLPTAVRIDWYSELTRPGTRDLISPEGFAELMSEKGIRREDTVVIYGDKYNTWATYVFWVLTLYGHPDVRMLNGGRESWMQAERETTFMVADPPRTNYPVPEFDPSRAPLVTAAELLQSLDEVQLIDARVTDDFTGAHRDRHFFHMDQESAASAAHRAHLPEDEQPRHEPAVKIDIRTMSSGHIPGALNIPTEATTQFNGIFRSVDDLREAFSAVDPNSPTVTYCLLGERGAHIWFVLTYLLGWSNVRNYYGSWMEWGNMVGMPIEQS